MHSPPVAKQYRTSQAPEPKVFTQEQIEELAAQNAEELEVLEAIFGEDVTVGAK